MSMLQSRILSTIEDAYGFHASSGSPLFRYANLASKVILVKGAVNVKNDKNISSWNFAIKQERIITDLNLMMKNHIYL